LAWELIDRFALKQPKLLSSKSFKQFRYANLPFFYRRWVFVVVSRALFSLRLNNAIFGSTTDIPYSGGFWIECCGSTQLSRIATGSFIATPQVSLG